MSPDTLRPRHARVRAFALVVGSAVLFTGLPAVGPLAVVSPAAAATCPCTVWPATATPGTPADSDTAAVEVGVKFRSDVAGAVTGIRFYKGTGNTGTHIGHLWDRAGAALATATFTGESASGWQQVLFAAPVPVAANTTYVASYYAPVGHYAGDVGFFATAGVDNAPLHALRDGVDGANGVYRYGTGGGFPSSTWQSANYWVDVVFTTSVADTIPPTVTGTSPAAGATGVPTTVAVNASFSEDVQSATIAFTLRNPAGTTVPAAQSYDAATRTATLTPSAALAASTVYTANVSGAKDTAGNTMAPAGWTFSTGAPSSCPCSVWPASATPAVVTVADASAVELGVKFRSSTAGFVQAIRFYKGPSNTGVHTGSLWSRTGTLLGTATFAGETASGWQQALLPSPVAISANTTYVASYHTNTGFYSANNTGLSAAVTAGPLTALASGTDGGDGVYRYGATGFPSSTYQASNYWVDVLFGAGADTTPPTVIAQTPSPGATGVTTGTALSATFSEDVAPASITFTVTSASGSPVAGTVSYASGARTATFTPSSPLGTSTGYTATVAGARDTAGNTMAGPSTWSFSTAAPPPPPPTQGPGGPVLVIGNAAAASSQFSLYTTEILRAEGLNEFATADLAGVTAATLSGYDVVILGTTPLTASQVSMFTTWVTGGGRLIAFRPDKQLAGLLGLSSTTNTVTEGYVKVDTTTAPGAGITDATTQFHSAADQYGLAGATAVATLYTTATAATTAPAVTLRSVGTSGGRAAAFTYDLPRSIVYTRQGNPAWAGQERDGQDPIRSDDMYFGGTSTDWVNLTKAAIPQADEQQRLLANLVTAVELDRKPLPRFWYFPRSAKAIVVATGDDHGNGGTAGRFDQYAANSPAGCVVTDWTCLRFSSYMYPGTPLSNAQAIAYRSAGFELGLHPQSNCGNFTPTSLESNYASQLVQFGQSWPGLPRPVTSRFHCIVYSDWASQPKTELRHGIRLDTNYYYWPGSWVNDRPGFMTGSGMPMRFADTDGTIIDVYQGATQMTDESGQSYPATPNALLDNALGPLGYYGAFVANMHTDQPTTFSDDQLLASATSRGVPIISAEQLLTWTDGRNGSSFGSVAFSANRLTFTVAAGSGANGLTAMVPATAAGGGTLTGLTRGGTAVPFTRTTVKGVQYALYSAAAGSYTATYAAGFAGLVAGAAQPLRTGPTVDTGATVAAQPLGTGPAVEASATDRTPPQLSTPAVFPLPDGTASLTWRTNEAAAATVVYGTAPDRLEHTGYGTGRQSAPAVVLTDLVPDRTYYYRMVSVDAAGNRTMWPAAEHGPASFVSTPAGVADRSLAQLRMGSRSGTYLQETGFGEVSLVPEDGQEFATPAMPGSWEATAEATGGRRQVLAGRLAVDGQRAELRRTAGAGRSLSFGATFDPRSRQAVGWRSPDGTGPAAVLTTRDGTVYAATSSGGRTTWQALPAGLGGTAHTYRIDWSTTQARYYVDDQLVATQPLAATAMRPVVVDSQVDGVPLTVDWVRMARYAGAGSYVSRVLDAHAMVTWDRASWQADLPAGTSLVVSVRTGSTPTPDASWSGWQTLAGPGARVLGSSRYLQYRLALATRTPGNTPVLRGIGFTHNGGLPQTPTEVRPG